jgi:pimeloyl-ACP methyl ester carboxylesterase
MVRLIRLCVLLFWCSTTLAQSPPATINNLVHTPGYTTSEFGALPQFTRSGSGRTSLILIPGLGFDGSVFRDFVAVHEFTCTIYTITIPGFGQTPAPPMPPPGTSYGEQTWTKNVAAGVARLIETEHLEKPVLVGHFVLGAQTALRAAEELPGRIGGVVVLGGPAKLIAIINGSPHEFPLDTSIAYVDRYTAPKFWGTIRKEDWDEGNYLPEVYSLDSTTGDALWQQSAAVPLPVMIRYLCEMWASDVTVDLGRIDCPVLVLRPTFSDSVLRNPVNNYLRPQFIDSWTVLAAKHPRILVKDIPGAAGFVWKDNPSHVAREMRDFLTTLQE